MSPEILPDDIIALRALVLAAWAERDAERSEKARLIEERDQLAGQNDRLRHLIRQLQRMQSAGVRKNVSGTGLAPETGLTVGLRGRSGGCGGPGPRGQFGKPAVGPVVN